MLGDYISFDNVAFPNPQPPTMTSKTIEKGLPFANLSQTGAFFVNVT